MGPRFRGDDAVCVEALDILCRIAALQGKKDYLPAFNFSAAAGAK